MIQTLFSQVPSADSRSLRNIKPKTAKVVHHSRIWFEILSAIYTARESAFFLTSLTMVIWIVVDIVALFVGEEDA